MVDNILHAHTSFMFSSFTSSIPSSSLTHAPLLYVGEKATIRTHTHKVSCIHSHIIETIYKCRSENATARLHCKVHKWVLWFKGINIFQRLLVLCDVKCSTTKNQTCIVLQVYCIVLQSNLVLQLLAMVSHC